MWAPLAAASLALIAPVLWDAFEAVQLPRRITRQFRLARLYYAYAWGPLAAVARCLRPGKRSHTFLSLFGPLSVLVLIAVWATDLIAGFALLYWWLGTRLHAPSDWVGLGTY